MRKIQKLYQINELVRRFVDKHSHVLCIGWGFVEFEKSLNQLVLVLWLSRKRIFFATQQCHVYLLEALCMGLVVSSRV